MTWVTSRRARKTELQTPSTRRGRVTNRPLVAAFQPKCLTNNYNERPESEMVPEQFAEAKAVHELTPAAAAIPKPLMSRSCCRVYKAQGLPVPEL